MNSTSSVPSVTLQTAVLMQVKEFAQTSQPFSVHDITRTIRNKTSSGALEIPEVEVHGASFRFDIPHSKVKDIFEELWRTGVFDSDFTLNRQFMGMYFVYTAVVNPNATSTTPVSFPATTNVSAPVANTSPTSPVDRTEVVARVETYLGNCKTRNFRPTLKQVQSAVKRGNVSTGWICDDLRDVIEQDLGYTVIDDPNYDYVSAAQVVL